MVHLCARLCSLFRWPTKDASKNKDIADLVKALKDLIPIAERELDGRLEVDSLKQRLGVGRAYAGVM